MTMKINTNLFFLFSFTSTFNYLGWTTFPKNFHFSRISPSPMNTPTTLILYHLFFVYYLLPHLLFLSMFIFITTLTAFVSFCLIWCPNQLSLFSLILYTIDATPILPLTYSLPILLNFINHHSTHPAKHTNLCRLIMYQF